MEYTEAIKLLTGLPRTAGAPGLERISYVLEQLGDPQEQLRVIHLAGTNGKGSTAMMIAKMLETEGHRVGLFISPYIREFTERIQINGKSISPRDLVRLTEKILPYIGQLTAFEAVTAIGFCYFLEQKCDWVVLETGLGGRFDATNTVTAPVLSVLTHMDLDHTELLGDTIAHIAREKCGIIRPRGRVITTPQQHPAALSVIREVCVQQAAQLTIARAVRVFREDRGVLEIEQDGVVYDLAMTAHYQTENAATALSVAACLGLSTAARQKGLSTAVQPGRFEWRNEHLVLDGAHNRNGIAALCETLRRTIDPEELCVVLGMLPDKEREEVLPIIRPVCSRLIIVPVGGARGDDGRAFYEAAKQKYPDMVDYQPDVKSAIAKAKRDVVCVCGSLYLMGEV